MFELTEEIVKKQVNSKTPGIYRFMTAKGDVKKVGMHFSDLQTAILKAIKPKYTHFDFKATASDKTAWQHLCEAFHFHKKNDFLDDDTHPEPPSGKFWTCHVCEESKRY